MDCIVILMVFRFLIGIIYLVIYVGFVEYFVFKFCLLLNGLFGVKCSFIKLFVCDFELI